VYRLEPVHTYADLSRALTAAVADPAWFLGRQWQLGEHRGENAASPVRVHYRASLVPVDPLDGDPGLDPRIVPPEAIIESEPGDFWTPGRRVTVGREVERAADDAGRPLPEGEEGLLLHGLPVPYDVLDGTGFDGRALFVGRAELGLPDDWFTERPPQPPPRDLWDPSELVYEADLTAGDTADAAPARRRPDGLVVGFRPPSDYGFGVPSCTGSFGYPWLEVGAGRGLNAAQRRGARRWGAHRPHPGKLRSCQPPQRAARGR